MKEILEFVGTIVILFALVFGLFVAYRWFNYTWGYAGRVENTVCEMVKPEVLIDPQICE